MPPDTLESLWREGRARLERARISSSSLDARLLLQACAAVPHARMISDPSLEIGADIADVYRGFIARREEREPVSRILGEREFYGRAFAVTPATLDPRPDTETVVDEALCHIAARQPARILDLGTGTGAIVVTLLAERPQARGVASDISADALAVAKRNASWHGVASRLDFVLANWFAGLAGTFDLIVSNPPYIPTGEIAALGREVRDFDPGGALDGGCDGLDAYRAIAAGARHYLARAGVVCVEIGEGQATDIEALFGENGYSVVSRRGDLGGHVRCLAFTAA
ncbi:peptide chain release factor N(5)-glutamine methyltransferase [soil metagenome]